MTKDTQRLVLDLLREIDASAKQLLEMSHEMTAQLARIEAGLAELGRFRKQPTC